MYNYICQLILNKGGKKVEWVTQGSDLCPIIFFIYIFFLGISSLMALNNIYIEMIPKYNSSPNLSYEFQSHFSTAYLTSSFDI